MTVNIALSELTWIFLEYTRPSLTGTEIKHRLRLSENAPKAGHLNAQIQKPFTQRQRL